MKKRIFISLITALTLTIFSSCASKSQPVGGEVEDTTVTTVTSETTTPPPPADSVVKITAAGDNLIHSSIEYFAFLSLLNLVIIDLVSTVLL